MKTQHFDRKTLLRETVTTHAQSLLPLVTVILLSSLWAQNAQASLPPAVFDFAVYATGTGCDALTIAGNAFIDSFDSSQGSYSQTRRLSQGIVGVSGNISLKGSATINGPVFATNTTVGTCQNGTPGISTSGKATATGGYIQLSQAPSFPNPDPVSAGSQDYHVTADATLAPGSYGNITVNGKAVLTLSPGTYILNSLAMSGQPSLTINPPGQVLLYIAGVGVPQPLQLTAGSLVNTSGIPLNLQLIYGGNLPISLAGGASSYAVLYAPNAAATLHGGSGWYGSMVVKTLDDSGNTSIHYDRSLAVPPVIIPTVTPAPNPAGWNNSNPTVTFTCSDPILGIASCTQPVVVTSEGANQAIPGTALNRAGFSATASASINLDKTPPIIGGTSAPPANAAGWNNSNVTASFTCSDSLSGIVSCTSPVTVTTDGGNQIVTGVAMDKAGNTAGFPVTINLDKTPPINTALIVPPPNGAGWNNSNANVTFTCSDVTSGVASCPPAGAVSTEGFAQVISGTATDRAGNATTRSVAVNVDKTPPTISAVASPAPNASGWNNSAVTANFTCLDALSGIASCPSPLTVDTDGANQTRTGNAIDQAGNNASTSLKVSVDRTPPTIVGTLSPAPNAAGWNNSDVTVTFTCSDATSGVASCTPAKPVSIEGKNLNISGTAVDKAGNSANASVTVNLDKTPPGITLSSPAIGSTISLSTNSIIVTGAANDTGSGLATVSCNGAPATLSGFNFNCAVSLTPGANSIPIQAADIAGNSSTSNLTLTYAPTPKITISSPANLTVTNLTPVTVTGTVSDSGATVKINGIPAPPANGTFSIPVPLVEGLNVLSAVATNASGVSSTASVQITLDTTPPHITIDSPADGATVTDASVTITGIANDVVVGTVNAQDVQVTVNEIPAQVANRSYAAANVPLSIGANTIKATGVDRAGNGTSTSITITRVLPSQPPLPVIGQGLVTYSLGIVLGNNQTGPIATQLTAPLVVGLTDSSNNPVPNQPVVFKVTANNGIVTGGGSTGSSVTVNTDSGGRAQIAWTVGQRAGAGNNTVQTSSPLAFNSVNFTATGITANPGHIVVDSGNGQTGVIGQPLPFPFVADVVDSGHNRVPNVPVTFTVKQGGASFGGQTTLTLNTDSNGRALAVLTLGLQEGFSNNVVEANFPGNASVPAAFTATGKAPGNPASTTISGIVLDNSNNPIQNATIRLFQTNQGNNNNLPVQIGTPVVTSNQGAFQIQNAPVGFFKLMADGSTVVGPKAYPTLEYDIVTIAGNDNTIGMPVYLPALNTVNKLCVDAGHGGTLTLPQYPGFALTVLPGSATFPGGSKTGCVTVTPVNGDKVPMAPGFGQQPRFVVTIQPVGTTFNPPAAITLPNVDGLKPKAVTEMYSYDHDLGMFVAIGTGTVSDDGSVIKSNPGVGVLKAGWHCGGDPAANGFVADCGDCNICQNGQCAADTSKDGQPVSASNQCIVCEDGAVMPYEAPPKVTTSQTFGVPAPMIDDINFALDALKPIGILAKLNPLQVTGTRTEGKCCDPMDGIGKEVSSSASGNFGGFEVNGKIWPPGPIPSVDKEFNLGIYTLKASAEWTGGVFLGLSGKVEGQIGYRSSDCAEDAAYRAGCFFGGLSTTLTPTLFAQVAGGGQLQLCTDPECLPVDVLVSVKADAKFVLGNISLPFNISAVNYNNQNDKDCTSRLQGGVLSFGQGSFKINADISGEIQVPTFGTYKYQKSWDFLSCTLTLSSPYVKCD